MKHFKSNMNKEIQSIIRTLKRTKKNPIQYMAAFEKMGWREITLLQSHS